MSVIATYLDVLTIEILLIIIIKSALGVLFRHFMFDNQGLVRGLKGYNN